MQESYSSVPVCSKGLLIWLDIFSDLNYLLTLNIYFFFLFYIYRVISYNFDILETFFLTWIPIMRCQLQCYSASICV